MIIVKNLEIREDSYSGIYINGLSEYICENIYDCYSLLNKGETNRKTRQTIMNDLSSRSHTIFQIIIESNQLSTTGKVLRGKLSLCDLAGNEKHQGINHSTKKEHFNEMININKSLLNLTNVINCLVKNQKHIPYRDSKLTRLLQDSLGGKTKTCFIITLSPSK